MPPDPGSATGSRHGADLTTAFGLSKEEVRRIVIDKLRVVYHDWHFAEVPFADVLSDAGERREDPRAFVIALVAACWGASPTRSKGTTRPSRRRSRGAAVLGRAPETHEVTCLSDRLARSLAERALRGEGPLCSGLHRHPASGSRIRRRRHASWRAAQASPTEGADTTSEAPRWCGRPGDRRPGRLR